MASKSAMVVIQTSADRIEPQVQTIRPAMTDFARATGFTAYLMVQAGEDAICAEVVTRATRRQFQMDLGARVPMGVGAGSVALLALLPEKEADRILRANASRYENHPAVRPVDVDVIRGKVEAARAVGHAVNLDYFLPGEGGIAIAIPADAPDRTNMAISFNAPLEMMSEEWVDRIVETLRKCVSARQDVETFSRR